MNTPRYHAATGDVSVLIMAGGTGGHVFPALAVARQLATEGVQVVWLGTPGSFESRLIPGTGIPFHEVPVSGLRGKGWLGWLKAPFALPLPKIASGVTSWSYSVMAAAVEAVRKTAPIVVQVRHFMNSYSLLA